MVVDGGWTVNRVSMVALLLKTEVFCTFAFPHELQTAEGNLAIPPTDPRSEYVVRERFREIPRYLG